MAKPGEYMAELIVDRWCITQEHRDGSRQVHLSPFPTCRGVTQDLAAALNIGRYENKMQALQEHGGNSDGVGSS